MHVRIPGDYFQAMADLSHRGKFKDNSFNSNGAHSDGYKKLTSSSKKLPWKFMLSVHVKEERLSHECKETEVHKNKENESGK